MNVCVFTSVKYLNSDIFYKKNAQKGIYMLHSVFLCDLLAKTIIRGFFFGA